MIAKEILEKNISKDDTIIVYTPAVNKKNNLLQYFLQNNFLVLKRSELLEKISLLYSVIAVAGTHGKTTTGLILTHIFLKTKKSFTSLIGGFLKNNPSNLIKTGLDTFIVEADEFDRSFLQLYPTFACITSIDPDHLDVYKTKKEFVPLLNLLKPHVAWTSGTWNFLPLPKQWSEIQNTQRDLNVLREFLFKTFVEELKKQDGAKNE